MSREVKIAPEPEESICCSGVIGGMVSPVIGPGRGTWSTRFDNSGMVLLKRQVIIIIINYKNNMLMCSNTEFCSI